MSPTDKIDSKKLKVIHALFRRIGSEGEAAVRDEIEQITGQRSSAGLNQAQAWGILDGIFRSLGEKNPFPIVVDWCPVYQRQRAELGAGSGQFSLPSQAQVWRLYQIFRNYGIADPKAHLAARFKLKDGQIRTAQEAWWLGSHARRMDSVTTGREQANLTRRRRGRPRKTA